MSISGIPTKSQLNSLKWMYSIYEIPTTKEEKFKNLIDKDIKQLIRPSILPEFEKDKDYRKQLNKFFLNVAVVVLNKKGFIRDLLKFAEANDLLRFKYKFDRFDFGFAFLPILNVWHAKLEYVFWLIACEQKYKNNKITIDYMPYRFNKNLLSLMKDYGLEYCWYESIVVLLLTGDWYLPRHSSVINLQLKNNRGGYEPTISFEISGLTTKEEIVHRWIEIKDLKNSIYGKQGQRLRIEDVVRAYSDKIKRLPDSLRRASSRAGSKYRKLLGTGKQIPDNIKKQIVYGHDIGLNEPKDIVFF
ncbi:MAG: hypothetical protein WCW03_01250 [Candidatus Paceibacterota bacterium]|jgi:hypothetical protein